MSNIEDEELRELRRMESFIRKRNDEELRELQRMEAFIRKRNDEELRELQRMEAFVLKCIKNDRETIVELNDMIEQAEQSLVVIRGRIIDHARTTQ